MSSYTLDTNIAVYAFSPASAKAERAGLLLAGAEFVSVQLLNEFAHVASRKMRLSREDVRAEVMRLRSAIRDILPVNLTAHEGALRLSARYRLPFYDSLMLSVALIGSARIFYSEDLQHGLLIDDTLRIVNPFRPDPA